jgi:hypothetical protein
MHRWFIVSLLLAAAIPAAAQPGATPGKPVGAPNTPVFTGLGDIGVKNSKARLLHGEVMDLAGKPLEKSVVYLKDKKTQKILTVTTGKDGLFHFDGLDPNQDYELHAEHQGSPSITRLLSMLDGRKDVTLNLRVEPKKPDDKKSPDDKKAPAPPAKPDDKKPDSPPTKPNDLSPGSLLL